MGTPLVKAMVQTFENQLIPLLADLATVKFHQG